MLSNTEDIPDDMLEQHRQSQRVNWACENDNEPECPEPYDIDGDR